MNQQKHNDFESESEIHSFNGRLFALSDYVKKWMGSHIQGDQKCRCTKALLRSITHVLWSFGSKDPSFSLQNTCSNRALKS